MTLTQAEVNERRERATMGTIRIEPDVKVMFLATYQRWYASFTKYERRTLRITHGTFVMWLCGLAAEALAAEALDRKDGQK